MAVDDPDLAALMAKLDDVASFSTAALSSIRVEHGAVAPSTLHDVARDGWLSLASAVDVAERSAISAAIDALAHEGLPPLFVYAYPAVWAIGARIAERISDALGARYDLIEDAWAFRVPVGPAHAGWPPHRGSYELSADRAAPDTLNVWIAISDATIDSSCMHVVPLDRDPAYPSDLRSHAAAATEGVALPVAAGTALAWNANVLHWGGPSSARAKEPRTSITFTLRRHDAARTPPRIESHAERLDVIADQVLVYGELERTLSEAVRRWAELRVEMRNLVRSRADSGVRKAP